MIKFPREKKDVGYQNWIISLEFLKRVKTEMESYYTIDLEDIELVLLAVEEVYDNIDKL
jgi:hypothetical protein